VLASSNFDIVEKNNDEIIDEENDLTLASSPSVSQQR